MPIAWRIDAATDTAVAQCAPPWGFVLLRQTDGRTDGQTDRQTNSQTAVLVRRSSILQSPVQKWRRLANVERSQAQNPLHRFPVASPCKQQVVSFTGKIRTNWCAGFRSCITSLRFTPYCDRRLALYYSYIAVLWFSGVFK